MKWNDSKELIIKAYLSRSWGRMKVILILLRISVRFHLARSLFQAADTHDGYQIIAGAKELDRRTEIKKFQFDLLIWLEKSLGERTWNDRAAPPSAIELSLAPARYFHFYGQLIKRLRRSERPRWIRLAIASHTFTVQHHQRESFLTFLFVCLFVCLSSKLQFGIIT